MASKTTAAQEALDAYRRELLSDSVETRIAELSGVVATYEATCRDRDRQAKALTARSWWTDANSLRDTFDRIRSQELAQLSGLATEVTTEDLALAADVLVSTLVCAVAADAGLGRHDSTLPILVSLSLVGFVGSVAVARSKAHSRSPSTLPYNR